MSAVMNLANAEAEMALRIQIEAVLDSCQILPIAPATRRPPTGVATYDLRRNMVLLIKMAEEAPREVRARFGNIQRELCK